MKQNPPECEEVSVSVTSASGRLGLRGSVRPPQVPAFPQEATVCSPDLPQLGGGGPVPGTAEQPGHSLARSRGLQKSHVVAQCPEAGRAGHPTVKEEPSWPRPGTLGSLSTRSLGKNTPETWITCKVFVITEGRKQRHRAFPSRGRRGRPGMPPPRMRAERRRPGALRPPALATPPRPVCLCG